MDYDVIVVGGGGAGLSAAIAAAKAGASVMVVEADTKLGGQPLCPAVWSMLPEPPRSALPGSKTRRRRCSAT
ncbi:hypothetical protein PPGU19_102630 (plasmid) [Paraburkholderia sp. PGU19]|uniref:FAD-dependent oxidoreductase n=1 Tax=Paraburkholderia sp. PGU19 TaxID=2735434 RepID=UPI0015DB9920|nr:FAD-dependent oxidoreductase [Paraburkholderia sp. PGU19]BCG05695.1 hypothetical protein PPGU19_102630 [Paraburkholderia sp. PGU19]